MAAEFGFRSILSFVFGVGGDVLKNKSDIQAQLDRALSLLSLCQRVDHAAVVAHEPEAVETLHEVVQILRRSLELDGSSLPASPGPGEEEPAVEMAQGKSALLERQRRFVEALSRAGLGDRLGKLYCSNAERRLVAFREVPHKLGLPQFDMVVAADYAPVSGYHGIFVGVQEVVSCILPLPAESHQWQVRDRHRFADAARAAELVSLMSAGFPVD